MADAGLASYLVFVFIACAFGIGSLILNKLFGARRRRSYLQDTTYECGEEPEGEAQIDFPSQHYVFAIVFVAVDVVGFILLLWASSFAALTSGPLRSLNLLPMVGIAVGFTLLALAGIYYALRGERKLWV